MVIIDRNVVILIKNRLLVGSDIDETLVDEFFVDIFVNNIDIINILRIVEVVDIGRFKKGTINGVH